MQTCLCIFFILRELINTFYPIKFLPSQYNILSKRDNLEPLAEVIADRISPFMCHIRTDRSKSLLITHLLGRLLNVLIYLTYLVHLFFERTPLRIH